jgi:Fe-coproporphyrin III synthase
MKHSRYPEEIVIELTSKCNLKCNFCFNTLNNKNLSENNQLICNSAVLAKSKKNKEKELSKKEVFALLDEIKKWGAKSVRFTGGEPFLRKDLEEIIRYAKYNKLTTVLNTNGTILSKKNRHIIQLLDYILLSVHDSKNLNQKKDFLNLIKNQKPCPIVMCCTIATKENIKNIEEFYRFISQFPRIDYWFILRKISVKKTDKISQKDIKILSESIISNNKKYNLMAWIANAVPFCAYKKELLSKICIGGKNDDGHTRIVISSKGEIKPDYYSKKVLGKIKIDKISDCWNSKYMKDIRNLTYLREKCRLCKYAEKCMGGLKFAADACDGRDPLAKK